MKWYSMGANQRYNLRWNDFHSTLASSFSILRNDSDFIDVTLACDGQSFSAHKVVLSACSVYLKKLLKANPCQHPIVILRDVRASILNSLLHFMYHGAVDISQNQLTDFLHAAQLLEIKGLSEDSNPNRDIVNTSCTASHISNNQSSQLSDLPSSSERLSSPPPKKLKTALHRLSEIHSSNQNTDNNTFKGNSPSKTLMSLILPTESLEHEEIIGDLHSVVDSLKVGHNQSVQSGELTIARINKVIDSQDDSSTSQENDQESVLLSVNNEDNNVENKEFKKEFELDYPVSVFSMKQEPFDNDAATSFEEEMPASQSPKSETVISGYSEISGIPEHLNAGSSDLNPYAGTSGSNQEILRGMNTSRLPQICPYCMKNFSTRGNLNLHVRNVHLFIDEQNWVSCSYCSKKFKTKDRLTVHQYYVHNVRIRQRRSHLAENLDGIN